MKKLLLQKKSHTKQKANGSNSPLQWWLVNSTKYPDNWNHAEKVLHLPALSAPE